MTAGELKAIVEETVQDASFTGRILPLFTRALGHIAAAAAKADKVLTGLEATATVATVTTASSVALPTDYGRGLYWVGSAAQRRRIGTFQRYHNFTSFLKRWPDPALSQLGPITDCVIKGTSLYYQPRAVDTLTLHYYKLPTVLDGDSDVPSCLPEHLQESLLVNFACREIYNLIEDGAEDPKTNTKVHAALYNSALAELLDQLEPSREEALYIGCDDEE